MAVTSDHPVPLQLQCLLYIVEHLDEIPTSLLSLLPLRIRHQLLLLLPAVDVCKLEGTSVTCGISMDEIWEDLHINRIFNRDYSKGDYQSYQFREFSSREDRQRRFNISLTWKESYFCSALMYLFKQTDSEYRECKCDTNHKTFDVLYSTFYVSSTSYLQSEVGMYLRKLSHSCRGLYENELCYRYTPSRYSKLIEGKSDPLITLIDFANLLLNTCFVSIRIFDQCECFGDYFEPKEHLSELSHPDVIRLFSSVEAVCFCDFPDGVDNNKNYIEVFDVIFSYDRTNLVKMIMIGGDTEQDPSDHIGHVRSLTYEEYNTSSRYFLNIFKMQNCLEVFTIDYSVLSQDVSLVIMKLFEISSMKQVTITACSSLLLSQQCIVDSFLASPYPIHLTLDNVVILVNEGTVIEKIDEVTLSFLSIEANGKNMTKTITIIKSELFADLFEKIQLFGKENINN